MYAWQVLRRWLGSLQRQLMLAERRAGTSCLTCRGAGVGKAGYGKVRHMDFAAGHACLHVYCTALLGSSITSQGTRDRYSLDTRVLRAGPISE